MSLSRHRISKHLSPIEQRGYPPTSAEGLSPLLLSCFYRRHRVNLFFFLCHAPCLLHSYARPWATGSFAGLIDSQESLLVSPGSGDRYDVHGVMADIRQAEVSTDSLVEKVSCVDAASDAVPNDETPELFQQLNALPLDVAVPAP